MITAGIDVGFENVKIVILNDGKIAGRATGESGGAGRAAAVEQLWNQALADAGIPASDVKRIAATGKGKHNVPFADERVTEPLSAFKAARSLCPDATAVVDVGADETLVATVKGDKIGEMVINQKCAAGLGAFLSYMGRRLELSPDQMSSLGRPGPESAVVNDGCVVFAELDALSLLNRGVPVLEVAAAITEITAVRASSVLNDITIPAWDKVLLVGGLGKNSAFVEALKVHAGIDFAIPGDPEYAGALGAALVAAESVAG